MKYTKRAVSLFIIATMIIAIFSSFMAVPVMAAISAPTVWSEDGLWSAEDNASMPIYYGTTLLVNGTGVVGGETVNIYWNLVQAAYLLNSTTADKFGNYECLIDVPVAYNGSHTIWAKDLNTGLSEVSTGSINVWSKITLSPGSGLPDDEITVKGYGFDANSVVEIGIYNSTVAPILDMMLYDVGDEEETDDDGSFELTFDIPDWDDGDYTVNCTDELGNLAEDELTIGPALTLDKVFGPSGTIVKVEGRGFTTGGAAVVRSMKDIDVDDGAGEVQQVSTKDGEDIEVSNSGTFTAYIVIPSITDGTEGDFTLTLTDGTKTATEDFEIDGTSTIEVSPTYGTPGTVLTVKGYNYTRLSGIDVNLNVKEQEAEATVDSKGEFTATITIPPLDFGKTYNVWANDTRNCNASDTVLVALIVLQLSDYSGPVGAEITLMGSGFEDGGQWNATFGDMDLIETQDIDAGKTYFSHDFYVPSVPSGTYTLGVYDADREITVDIDFTVTDQATLSISRASIPNEYNLTIEGENFVELEGVTTQWYLYNSTDVWDLNTDVNVTTGGPGNIPETTEDGTINAWYEIPKFLELGTYTLNCTTVSNDMVDPEVTQHAEIEIEIVPEEVILNVGSPSYARGQTVTFVIKATLKKADFELGIKDPEGSEVFNSSWVTGDWKTIGSWYYIPSNLQIDDNIGDVYSLPADALAGTWTYAFWTAEKVYATGTFEVTELTEIEQLQQDIGGVASSLLDLGTSVTDLAGSVVEVSGAAANAAAAAAAAATAADNAKAAADAAAAAVADVADTAQDALDAANDAKTSADAAKDAADSGLAAANDAKVTAQAAADAANDAKTAAETTQQQTSGLTTLVYGAIGASLIAALAAIVSLMQISRRIAG
jgi:hypothetical protein